VDADIKGIVQPKIVIMSSFTHLMLLQISINFFCWTQNSFGWTIPALNMHDPQLGKQINTKYSTFSILSSSSEFLAQDL